MNRTVSRIVAVALVVASAAMTSSVMAQSNYPSSPIRLIVAFPPGVAVDTIGRGVAQRLDVQMNTSIIVDNKPGAGGGIGAEFVAKSKPDGYTLLICGYNLITAAALGDKAADGYLNELAPVSLVASAPHLIVVHPSVPANTLAEFIAYVKANPGKLSFGTAGTGSLSHFQTLKFLQAAGGLSAVHVPYKGDAPAAVDLAAGRIQFEIMEFSSGMRLAQSNRVRALAITTTERSPLMPDVPVAADTVPGFESGNTYGINAPLKTPRPILQKLSVEIMKAVRDPALSSELQKGGIMAEASTPEAYAAFVKSERERFNAIAKKVGLQNTEAK